MLNRTESAVCERQYRPAGGPESRELSHLESAGPEESGLNESAVHKKSHYEPNVDEPRFTLVSLLLQLSIRVCSLARVYSVMHLQLSLPTSTVLGAKAVVE